MSVSAPAGTRAMRFSFVLISLGTPIFISNCELQGQNKPETYLAGGCFSPARSRRLFGWFHVGPKAHHRLSRRIEKLARELVHGFGLDRIDQGEHLIQGPVRLAVQVDCGRPIHPSRWTLERQGDLSL